MEIFHKSLVKININYKKTKTSKVPPQSNMLTMITLDCSFASGDTLEALCKKK